MKIVKSMIIAFFAINIVNISVTAHSSGKQNKPKSSYSGTSTSLSKAESIRILTQALKLEAYIKRINPQISSGERKHLVKQLIRQSQGLQFPVHFTIDRRPINKVAFLAAMVQVESTFKRTAVSRSNAQGYMQLKQSTVVWMDKKMGYKPGHHMLFHTSTNLNKAVNYLNYLSGIMKNVRYICLAYNAGPGSVNRGYWHEKYWRDILRNYRSINAQKQPNHAIASQLAIN